MSTQINFILILFTAVLLSSCLDDTVEPIVLDLENTTLWEGDMLTFTKADGADFTLPANQDRITNNVWITRGNEGGQIFNIALELQANKDVSPDGTLWADGEIQDYQNLAYGTFRQIVTSPKDVVGKNLLMYIVADDVMLSVRFTSWSEGRAGGFGYERSTP